MSTDIVELRSESHTQTHFLLSAYSCWAPPCLLVVPRDTWRACWWSWSLRSAAEPTGSWASCPSSADPGSLFPAHRRMPARQKHRIFQGPKKKNIWRQNDRKRHKQVKDSKRRLTGILLRKYNTLTPCLHALFAKLIKMLTMCSSEIKFQTFGRWFIDLYLNRRVPPPH